MSPGVTVYEKDFTSIVPAVSGSVGAFAGKFPWGPVLYPMQLTSENDLVSMFGKPNSNNFESFFTAANFLAYSGNMYICRQDSATGVNAVSYNTNTTAIVNGTAQKLNNIDAYTSATLNGTFDWAAKYPGTAGNSIKVSFADAASYQNLSATGTATVTLSGTALVGVGTKFLSELHVGAIVKDGSGNTVGTVVSIADNTNAVITAATTALAGVAFKIDWAYATQFDSVPGTSTYVANQGGSNDELHIIVVDANGVFSGTAGTVLEKFAFVSKAIDAKKNDGTSNYYKDVINNSSKYIWWGRATVAVAASGTAWGALAAGTTFKSTTFAPTSSLTGGVDDYTDTGSYAQAAWLLYLDDNQYDISLLPVGKATSTTANYVIQNICEVRKDCIAFVSPQDNSTGAVITGFGTTATNALVTYRNAITSSSFGFMDTGYKYQYDRYNDVYRWVPLSGDVAGLAARTDATNDPWWSPAGDSRGQIKNVVKLAINPTKADRDTIYKLGINPVVAFSGRGVQLFGDKTLLSKPSAFGSIGVRRLFITVEKAIAIASRSQLFEFNDAFTRAQFRAMVEPFLADVQGRRGIIDFRVKCDSTNNTGEVIDRGEFVADIYIKPNRSINYITLSFIATRTGIDFSTIGA